MGSAGSGVIVDAERGYVLTNTHVVKGANLIEVTTRDKRRFKAELVGRDPETDLAVLRIKAEQLTAMPLGDSDQVQVGDFVLAIGNPFGNPFGLGQTVTSGIVSALGRTGLGTEGYGDFIQTDASINPSNSDGALVTLNGRLIGINTAIFSRRGGNVGIGFAAPINKAKSVIEQIIAHREVKRGRIGVLVQDVIPELAQALGVEGQGAVVSALKPGSPAAVAGLTKGDVVTAIDNTPIRDASHLHNLVGSKRVGTTIEITSWRKGAAAKTVSVRIEPGSAASATGKRRSISPG
jgi:S1-C subfamily serine protease